LLSRVIPNKYLINTLCCYSGVCQNVFAWLIRLEIMKSDTIVKAAK
jgi:hypothetical protein